MLLNRSEEARLSPACALGVVSCWTTDLGTKILHLHVQEGH